MNLQRAILCSVFVMCQASWVSAAESLPKGWFAAGSHPQDYVMGRDTSVSYRGKSSGFIRNRGQMAQGFGALMQQAAPDLYLGKRVQLSAYMKAKDVENWACLWFRIDGSSDVVPLGYDNMQDRPLKGTFDWQQVKIVLDVPRDSKNFAFGVILNGKGSVWVDGLKFETVAKTVPTTGSKIDRNPHNLDFEK